MDNSRASYMYNVRSSEDGISMRPGIAVMSFTHRVYITPRPMSTYTMPPRPAAAHRRVVLISQAHEAGYA